MKGRAIMIQKKCFGCSGGKCSVLTDMYCRDGNCPFYKTQLTYIRNIAKYGWRDDLVDDWPPGDYLGLNIRTLEKLAKSRNIKDLPSIAPKFGMSKSRLGEQLKQQKASPLTIAKLCRYFNINPEAIVRLSYMQSEPCKRIDVGNINSMARRRDISLLDIAEFLKIGATTLRAIYRSGEIDVYLLGQLANLLDVEIHDIVIGGGD